MNVLFNALCLYGRYSGVQYYSFHLLREAMKDPESFRWFNAVVPRQLREPFPELFIRLSVENRIERILREHFCLPAVFRGAKSTLLHAPSYIAPLGFEHPYVLTVHDTIALDHPEFCSRSNALYFGLLLKSSIKRARHVIAVSNRVKEDITRHCPAARDKISVIYHGTDPSFKRVVDTEVLEKTRKKYGLPQNFLLFVGNIEPKKNLVKLLGAFEILRKNGLTNHTLVIAGQWGWKNREVEEKKKIFTHDQLFFLDYVDREDLPSLYSMAALFVFPSLYEGFGIPPLEAMACGTPVLASDRGALGEITGNLCFLTDPCSEEKMAGDIHRALTDFAARDIFSRCGLEHTRKFTWQQSWQKTKELYEQMA